MRLPMRRFRRPRLTLAQVLATVAVSSVPLALLASMVRGSEVGDDPVGAVVFGVLCAGLVGLAELIFWGSLVPNIPPLRRLVGVPRWVVREMIVDPTGIRWVDEGTTSREP